MVSMRRVSVHCQRPDSIFEVEWGTGQVVALDAQSSAAATQPTSLPPPATVLAYPKPVTKEHVLPVVLQQQNTTPAIPPPHGFWLGTLRFQVEHPGSSSDGMAAATSSSSSSSGTTGGTLWEALVNLDTVLFKRMHLQNTIRRRSNTT